MEITQDLAVKILGLIDQGLVKGIGEPIPGQMCIEACVNYAMGLPHGDEPACVAPVLRALKIRLNDKAWSSSAARAAGLRRLGLAQLGSAGVLDEKEFLARVVEMTIDKIVPRAMRSVARRLPNHAEKLEEAALLCEAEPVCASALKAKADASAAYSAYSAASRDKELAFFAEEVVQILVAMGAPGCQWLSLAPL